MKRLLPFLLLLLLAAHGGIVGMAKAAATLDAVVRTGDTAYDADGVTVIGTFASVGNACVNTTGDVVFTAVLAPGGGVSTLNNEGIWVVPAGQAGIWNHKLAREGDAPPEGNGVFNHFSTVVPVNDQGVVAFRATIRGTGSIGNNAGIYKAQYLAPPATISLVARKGNAAPDKDGNTTGALFDTLEEPALADDAGSTVSFRSTLRVGLSSTANTTNNLGLWTDTGGVLKLLARKASLGDNAAPDAPGTTTKFTAFNRPCMNSSGAPAFYGALRGRPNLVNSLNNAGIWTGASTSTLAAAPRKGRLASGTNTYSYFATMPPSFGFNGSGHVAFNALIGGSIFINGSNNAGIWKGSPAAPDLFVRRGDTFAGGNGEEFQNFAAPVLLSDSGDAAFLGTLWRVGGLVDGSNDVGIWKGQDSDSLALVARIGDSAPDGAGNPIAAGEILFYKLYSTCMTMNQYGQLAFRSMLRRVSGQLSGFADDGIWATESGGTLVKVIQDGDTLGGETVQRHTFVPGSGGNDARPRAFSFNPAAGREVGQLVFTAYLANGTTGVYMADVP